MKVCIIKQLYDVLGPNTSFKYKDITIDDIFNNHIAKYNGLESYLLFEADSYILNSYNFTRHECECIKNNNLDNNVEVKKIYFNNLGKTISEKDIPYGEYDIVWCRDPILNNIKHYKIVYPRTLFIYEEVEHERGTSNKSNFYDLILKHNKSNFANSIKLPSVISFPYPKCPDKIRNIINIDKIYQIYIDYRDICKLCNCEERDKFKDKIKSFYNYIKNRYKIPIVCNLQNSLSGCCFSFEGVSDVKPYLELLGKSKYYVSTYGRVGQALVDAACLNCICFGTSKSHNHKILCHPFTLFNNFQLPETILTKINEIENNKTLEKEILEYQNQRLYKYYVDYQKNVLKKALELKMK